ncbi:TatD family hydrolase [Collinsella sp. zg1085]|uniref:TatD family hydrolase n=1 Tax=Collinsella sp. zg1085 TaxID=2844380 RepID=UPI001C0ADD78|nr:TatD family hydrolase [Collinsella sp. zg1085]QWT18020.1 TatD family hydrolase [Collinsella sp. zg1085]
MYRFVDMHCHLDRIAHATQVAAALQEQDIAVFCTPVTPEESLCAQHQFEHELHIRVGVGMHPWWIEAGKKGENLARIAGQLAATSPFVGEIGLDAGPAHLASYDTQLSAFCSICEAMHAHPLSHRVLSIHAVKAAHLVLDTLEHYGLLSHAGLAPIFHWFSGTSDDLVRIRRAGAYISVNKRMLVTKRGREYARVMPLSQLLLETDAPPQLDKAYAAKDIQADLETALDMLTDLRQEPRARIERQTSETGIMLLQL